MPMGGFLGIHGVIREYEVLAKGYMGFPYCGSRATPPKYHNPYEAPRRITLRFGNPPKHMGSDQRQLRPVDNKGLNTHVKASRKSETLDPVIITRSELPCKEHMKHCRKLGFKL